MFNAGYNITVLQFREIASDCSCNFQRVKTEEEVRRRARVCVCLWKRERCVRTSYYKDRFKVNIKHHMDPVQRQMVSPKQRDTQQRGHDRVCTALHRTEHSPRRNWTGSLEYHVCPGEYPTCWTTTLLHCYLSVLTNNNYYCCRYYYTLIYFTQWDFFVPLKCYHTVY